MAHYSYGKASHEYSLPPVEVDLIWLINVTRKRWIRLDLKQANPWWSVDSKRKVNMPPNESKGNLSADEIAQPAQLLQLPHQLLPDQNIISIYDCLRDSLCWQQFWWWPLLPVLSASVTCSHSDCRLEDDSVWGEPATMKAWIFVLPREWLELECPSITSLNQFKCQARPIGPPKKSKPVQPTKTSSNSKVTIKTKLDLTFNSKKTFFVPLLVE